MTDTKPVEDLDKPTRRLIRLALAARKRAYVPYSKFRVGCALVDSAGKVHTGCNVENASYGAAICAERSAIVKMVSRKGREVKRLVVVTSSEEPAFPCGLCLQVIHELGKRATVVAVNGRATVYREMPLTELFPAGFSREQLLR